jgi:oxygen-independent coproporphyrinogen-3 oxidase
MGFSLYIHIPYCRSKCPYCDFNSYASAAWPEREYVAALEAEMASRMAEAPWNHEAIATIFFGGGTPSLFTPESIAAIIRAADRLRPIESDAEITLEANPGTVTHEKLVGYLAAGVNRLSIGAQSFNEAVLRFLGRNHDTGQTRDAVRIAHQAGFHRLNLDLIFAIPGQKLDDAVRDIEEAVALQPDHISAYNLTFEEGTALFAEMRRGRISPMASDDQAEIFHAVRHTLASHGYPMYEISNYAPPGHEARHNLTYWRADSYLGIGAGAHSYAAAMEGGRRWWNERVPGRYIERVLATGRAEAGAEAIDAATAASEFVFLNLRMRAGFRISEFERRFGINFDSRYGEPTVRLTEAGFLEREPDRLYLTERGIEVADSVFAEYV